MKKLLLLLLAASLSSCALSRHDFDADETVSSGAATLGTGPDFEVVTIDRIVPSHLLEKPTGPYRVGPGDLLDLEVAENGTTRTSTRVMPDGKLYYDVADGVQVKGKSLREISQILSTELAEDYPTPIVSVNLAEASSQRVWLMGQVKNPGAYPIARPTTLLQAVSQAGGMYNGSAGGNSTEEMVDLDRSLVIRNGEPIPVDFTELVKNGDMSQNIYVEGGDYIYLPSVQHSAVYVLGAVQNPGPVRFENQVSALSALAVAGGHDKNAVITKALIIRGSLHSPSVAVINLNGIMRGNANDVPLVPGDILWVPKSEWTYLKKYVESVVFTAAQAVAVQGGIQAIGASGGSSVTISAGAN
jgi:polysaccharide export outer membrane protein